MLLKTISREHTNKCLCHVKSTFHVVTIVYYENNTRYYCNSPIDIIHMHTVYRMYTIRTIRDIIVCNMLLWCKLRGTPCAPHNTYVSIFIQRTSRVICLLCKRVRDCCPSIATANRSFPEYLSKTVSRSARRHTRTREDYNNLRSRRSNTIARFRVDSYGK